MTTYKIKGNELITVTMREIQERRVVITRTEEFALTVAAYAGDGAPFMSSNHASREQAQRWAGTVWLDCGDTPINWTYKDDGTTETWTSDTVITAGGSRFNEAELDYIRQHWRKK